MEKLGLNEIRELFKDFYVSKGHYPGKSASLIPQNDKSLLIINSGMAPLKPYFAGLEKPPAKTMTTCQKCIRTGDIENVGITSRHGTFFEMLGNFSFGDYFKEQSLTWGWEFIKDYLKLPEEKVWATVYEDDDEAVEIWKKLGMPEERIVRLGKKDNFWEIGLGPCGPCSEIYFDRGPEYGCNNPDCKPGCECDRYIEFWNHVFTQFSKGEDGNYTPLAHPNIDTGMGLERLACIMQGVDSIFDIDTIRFILDEVVKKSGVKYEDGAAKTDISIRIITDHVRSVVFMIGDGIIPSNEGRGYVLRRLLRRAARHGKILGIDDKFLVDLSNKVIEISGDAYPELISKKDYIQKNISVEEDKFAQTIDQGTSIILEYVDILKKEGKDTLEGEKAFKLYDTYGFPLELTEEILAENDCKADTEGFARYMEEQKQKARAGRKSSDDEGWKEKDLDINLEDTIFTGYEKYEDEGTILKMYEKGQETNGVEKGETASICLDKTPFYAECGGQIYDKGIMSTNKGMAEVLSVENKNGVYLHNIIMKEGVLLKGDKLNLQVDKQLRNQTARNHTATHLLQAALREIVGNHVQQAGSSVNDKSLRFDFTHFQAVTEQELDQIENLINSKINEFIPVTTEVMSMDEAVKSGAMALFGEKYGNNVRVVKTADFSVELCGGTHVSNTGQIGAFKIISETGVASGVRRIEALTGTGILKKALESESVISDIATIVKSNPSAVVTKVNQVNEELKNLKKELDEFKKSAMGSNLDELLQGSTVINGVKLITKEFSDYNINDLRNLSDEIKSNNSSVIMVFATVIGEKVTFLVSITDDLLDKGYHAGKMIKDIAAACGGGGGGKADMAQAGAKDPSKIKDAFTVAESLI